MANPSEPCPGCAAETTDDRCSQCGVARHAGRYRVLRVLAQTPHSRTYVAEDAAGQKVALKELIFAAVPTAQQLDAFEREGRLLAEVDHPRVPKLIEAFRAGEGTFLRLYLAQVLVEGQSLSQRLQAGAIDEREARDIAAQVLEVLESLHTRTPPVVHRDVKPHNLIVRPDASIALVDFGAAKELLAGGVTHQATLVGTYGYMPPDQLAGSVDPTCDLYALGATLMHALTGRPPDKLMSDELELGAKVSLNSSPDFERFVRKLCAKNASRRFASAAAARQALNALPPSVRRPRRLAKPVATMVAATLIATSAIWRLAHHAAPATDQVWAWEPAVIVFEDPNAVRPTPQTIPIGTELTVDRECECPGFRRLSPPRQGYVQNTDVRSEAPQYDAILEHARTALGNAHVDDAVSEARRANALREEREPLAILQALYAAQELPEDARAIAERLEKFGPAPAVPIGVAEPRSGPEPKRNEWWFVGATTLRMRKAPRSEAPVIAELGINAQLQITSLSGEWAEVAWQRPPHSLEFDFSSEPREETVVGWVAHRYLAREAADKAWLIARADRAQERGDAQDLVRQLARASAVDPVDRELQRRLAKAAVATRDYGAAASAAVAASDLLRGREVPLAELRVAYRCRGDRPRAEWMGVSKSVAHMPDNVCVDHYPVGDCAPCDSEPTGSEALDVAARARDAEATREYQTRERERLSAIQAVDGAFPDGAWLRVRVTGVMRSASNTNRVFVYQVHREETHENDLPMDCISAVATVEAIDTVPVPPSTREVTIWVRLPSYDGIYGVAFGHSRQEVEVQVADHFSTCSPGDLRHSIITTVSPTCASCTGC